MGYRQPWRNNRGLRHTAKPRVSVQKTKNSKPLVVKTSVGFVGMGETPSLTGEFTICLWEAREVTESGTRAKQVALFPF